jgi:hypothetical protein
MFHQDHGQRTPQIHPEYNVNSVYHIQLNYTSNLAKKSVKMVSSYVKWFRQHAISTWAKTVPARAGHWILLFPLSRNVRKFSPKIKLFLLLKRQPFAPNQQGNYFAGHSDPEECLITLSFPLFRQASKSSLLLLLQSDQHVLFCWSPY